MPGSEAMQPAIVTGFATYALVIASPAVFLTLALRWFSEPAPAPAPWFGSGPMRWRQVTATAASRQRLSGPSGIMFSLLIGMQLNVPVRQLAYLGHISPITEASHLWTTHTYVLVLAHCIVFSIYIS